MSAWISSLPAHQTKLQAEFQIVPFHTGPLLSAAELLPAAVSVLHKINELPDLFALAVILGQMLSIKLLMEFKFLLREFLVAQMNVRLTKAVIRIRQR